jgi:hypothetical protein
MSEEKRRMRTFSAEEARGLIRTIADVYERESGLGDVVLRIETASGETFTGHLVELDGASSPGGVMLNDGERAIGFEEIVWIGMGYEE